jgi:hypothetical protein
MTMAVTVADFVRRKISDRAITRACQYAQVSLTRTYNRMGTPYFDRRLIRIVAGVAAEATFLEWLQEMQIPYSLKGRTPWYAADRSDIVIAGYRCDVKTLDAHQPFTNLAELLDWCALVPVDQIRHADIYVFGYVSARVNYGAAEMQPLPNTASSYRWLTHVPWQWEWYKRDERKDPPLGHLSCHITNPADAGAVIELGGTKIHRRNKRIAFSERITLSTSSQSSQHQFYELLYVRWLAERLPAGAIVIEAGTSKLCETIPSVIGFIPSKESRQRKQSKQCEQSRRPPLLNGWYDIWLYDAEVVFVGWASQEMVREWPILKHKQPCPPVSATQTRNYHGFVRQLEPLNALARLHRP